MDKQRSITLIENQAPIINGEWKVGEVLGMAQALARFVESLGMGQPTAPHQDAPEKEVD